MARSLSTTSEQVTWIATASGFAPCAVMSADLVAAICATATARMVPGLTWVIILRVAQVRTAAAFSPAACALGLIHAVLPAPDCPEGLAGWVQVVATRPRFRRSGYARAVLGALLERLRSEHVTLLEVQAGEEAAPLYRVLGFAGSATLMRTTHREEPALVGGQATGGGTRGGGDPGRMPLEIYAGTVLKATCFACVYFIDEDDRPLQLHSVYSPAHPWQLVGGTMDPGERPWATAVRECREETALTVAGPPRLLATVYGLPGAQWPYSTLGLVFDGGRLTAAQIRSLTLDPREHDEARVLPLAGWEALMPSRDFARLTAVAGARRSGVAAYVDAWDWETE
ncbi:GNAT family N-acetyltransferase [Streptomyces andamanensis]|uniref:GNAT family N-acetyltransferase n=1 Tax=Streptomyces andamanensis TaxID=1565035 RepID=A0ABV8T8C9_9ACTN